MSNFDASPSNRIAKKDVAETFGESDVSVTHTLTRVSGGSIELSEETGTTCDTAEGSSINYNASAGDTFGLKINPNNDLKAVEADVGSGTNSATGDLELRDGNNNVLDSHTGVTVSGGEIYRFTASLVAGTTYKLVFVETTNESVDVENAGGNFPISTTDLDVTGGIYGGGGNNNGEFFWDDVTAIKKATSGEVAIEWPTPKDVFRWDAATFQQTPDGETVQVDIQESTDGGSTWTTIATDIDRGQEITADPSSLVRLKVSVDRTNTANNPTLDAAARRWVL